MHVRFVVNILGTKNCTQSVLKPHNKSPETRINTGFPSSIFYSNSTPFSVTWCKIGSVQTSDLLLFLIFFYSASRFRTF